MVKIIPSAIFIILLFTLTACEKSNKNLPAFANPDAPEYRALSFFDAIYNERSISKAQQYTTEKLGRIIRSYGTTRGYARYILDLQIDPGVELNIDRSLNQVTTDSANQTSVNILFTGTHNESTVKDVRKVNFIKVKGEWIIDSIEDDPYMGK